jgi:hypothetical protein
MTAAERDHTAHTLDETVWVRVAGSGEVLGVQLEPAVMSRPGSQIAARIQACADVAWMEGQLLQRQEWESAGLPSGDFADMPTVQDLEKARAYLRTLG